MNWSHKAPEQHVLHSFQLKYFQFNSYHPLRIGTRSFVPRAFPLAPFAENDGTSRIHFAFSRNTPCETVLFKVPIGELACKLNVNSFKGKAAAELPNRHSFVIMHTKALNSKAKYKQKMDICKETIMSPVNKLQTFVAEIGHADAGIIRPPLLYVY